MSAPAVRKFLRLVLAAMVLHLILVQPNHPGAMMSGALLRFPLELPVILLGLAAIGPGRVSLWLRIVLVALLTLVAVLKTADLVMFLSLSRGFNPVADLPLVDALVRLLAGAVGSLLAALAVMAALVAVVAIAALCWWATGVWSQLELRPGLARLSAAAALLAGIVMVAEVGHAMRAWRLPASPPGMAFTARIAVERARTAVYTIAELRDFRAAAANDPYDGAQGLFDAIDRDVLVIFIESYGRTSLDTPLYAPTHAQTLRAGAARLAALGLATRSGIVTAPTRGGQSWLSHATLANGLWITDQSRYGAALVSGRRTLYHLAGQAGFHTAAVMPQITMDWPESAHMGFTTILASNDLGYRGLPFNWVTMPDQFTLAALDRLLRTGDGESHLFAQVALSTSHAPWVPVPELIDWEDVGDGSVFNDMATAGDTPEVVWRDRDRVRDQYRLAIDYSLRTVIDYAARHAAQPPLMIVLGDHQAAGFVAQDERFDVPVHVIGPAHLVDRVADWGWQPGLVPAADTPVISMGELRNMVLDAFSDAAARPPES
ncbi:sulfatase [Neoaquamicrobium microcysteis]|uniref:sulfatase n=1 Tax=Neoaquamicrobium microcysteis TaxID=2682781 RepID=UPI00191BD6D3|nr:sulfatase [Mesorhizobium microcysteis]